MGLPSKKSIVIMKLLQSNWAWNGILFKLSSDNSINDLILHFDGYHILGVYIKAVVLFRAKFSMRWQVQDTKYEKTQPWVCVDLVRAHWQGWRVLISLICSLRPSYNIQIRRSAPLCTARQATTRPNHNFVGVNTTRHATSQVVIHNHYKHDIHTMCSSKHYRTRYNTTNS